MAITSQYSTQYTAAYITVPSLQLNTTELHGELRHAYFTHTQVGVGDTGSSVALFKLPPGRTRLLGALSRVYVNWVTASAKLDLGWDAYTTSSGVAVVADPDGLIDGLDVDAVGFRTLEGAIAAELLTGGTHVFDSRDGVVIRATATDNAQANNDYIAGCVFYVYD